jgi:hypothetical protein
VTITEALVATAVILVFLYFVFWALSSLSDRVASRQHDRRRARRRNSSLQAPEVPAWAEQAQPRPLPPWAGQDVGRVAELYGGSHWTGMAGGRRRPAPKPIDLEES